MSYQIAIFILIITPTMAAKTSGFHQACLIFLGMILYGYFLNSDKKK